MGRTTYQNVSSPGFVVDPASVDRNAGRQMDWDNVPERFRSTPGQEIKMAAAALADAVSLTVDALAQPVTAGTLLYFGESGEHTRVSANAAAGATTLAVEAPHGAIEDNDVAVVTGAGYKHVPAGTRVAQDDTTGKIRPLEDDGDVPADHTLIGLLATDANEDAKFEALTGYGVIVGANVYLELLPETLDSTAQTALAAIGKGFAFETYADDRAS